jgi:hypothetical protein
MNADSNQVHQQGPPQTVKNSSWPVRVLSPLLRRPWIRLVAGSAGLAIEEADRLGEHLYDPQLNALQARLR